MKNIENWEKINADFWAFEGDEQILGGTGVEIVEDKDDKHYVMLRQSRQAPFKSFGINEQLSEGFDDINEAREFAEDWMKEHNKQKLDEVA